MSFATLKTGIDGLDGILGGGIRFPEDSGVFLCLAGGPGTGKTLLALEMVVRAWLEGEDGATFLYYSVEHTPESIEKKLRGDFDWFGSKAAINMLPKEVPGRIVLQAKGSNGTTRLSVTQARPASLMNKSARGTMVDIEWILAEIENHQRAAPVAMVVIDNVGLLLTDLEYLEKRTALLEVRRRLLDHQIHGIFVMEEAHPRDLRLPSAEEFSTDLMIYLSFREEASDFKARAIEITKARHQYYYRGIHHFSVAGRGITRDIYLGARNERGPGIHIYPSVAAQLSMARDQAKFTVPARGKTIELGHPDLDRAFQHGTGPAERSSTVLLGEPGTRSTFLALRFLAAGLRRGETVLLVSTLEDRDAIRRICEREPVLREVCLTAEGKFRPNFRVVYLHPEFIAPGKFTWDLIRLCLGGHADGEAKTVTRLAFDNIHRLEDRFPLIRRQRFLIAAMLDMLRYLGVTTMFVDMVPPQNGRANAEFDPSPYLVGFDTVLHLTYEPRDQGSRPYVRVVKSVGNDYVQEAISVDWRRV